METLTISSTERQRFAAKLETFAHGLAPKEQLLLLEILGRAAAAPDGEVQGHMIDPSLLYAHHITSIPGEDLDRHLHTLLEHLHLLPYEVRTLPIQPEQ